MDNPHALALALRLLSPEERADAARELAGCLGADELIFFIPDPEIGAPLPAPGFPQTIPEGRSWQAFLHETERSRHHRGILPFPDQTTQRTAEGIALPDHSLLILLGGETRPRSLEQLSPLLQLVTASYRRELDHQIDEARVQAACQTAIEAHALAEALERSRRDLRQALVEARGTRDLLTRELATRDEFLATVAHDLKNPLASIKGIAQILNRRVARQPIESSSWLTEGLATMDATATRMAEQLNQILDLTRLNMGCPLQLTRQVCDLGALARRVAAGLGQASERHDIVVDAPEDLTGEWDGVRLDRVISNLITNAIKYSPAGDVIRVSLRREEADGQPWAVLTVQDHGLGIPAADLPLIFERFHRGGNVTGQIAGTGIGLASARQVVEQHGGSIEVGSVLGEGSTFTVRLPMTAQPASANGTPQTDP